jgi:hypothetical protein
MAEDAAAKVALIEKARADAQVAFERRQAEADRRREREYRKAIAEGGDTAREARWQRASSEALDRNVGLCQWQNDDDVHICFRFESFAGGVYCRVHNRELERETARRRRDDERATHR